MFSTIFNNIKSGANWVWDHSIGYVWNNVIVGGWNYLFNSPETNQDSTNDLSDIDNQTHFNIEYQSSEMEEMTSQINETPAPRSLDFQENTHEQTQIIKEEPQYTQPNKLENKNYELNNSLNFTATPFFELQQSNNTLIDYNKYRGDIYSNSGYNNNYQNNQSNSNYYESMIQITPQPTNHSMTAAVVEHNYIPQSQEQANKDYNVQINFKSDIFE